MFTSFLFPPSFHVFPAAVPFLPSMSMYTCECDFYSSSGATRQLAPGGANAKPPTTPNKTTKRAFACLIPLCRSTQSKRFCSASKAIKQSEQKQAKASSREKKRAKTNGSKQTQAKQAQQAKQAKASKRKQKQAKASKSKKTRRSKQKQEN